MSTLKFSQRERLPEFPLPVVSATTQFKKKCCKKYKKKKGKRCKSCPGR